MIWIEFKGRPLLSLLSLFFFYALFYSFQLEYRIQFLKKFQLYSKASDMKFRRTVTQHPSEQSAICDFKYEFHQELLTV